ncbi:MAG: 50S ribosomal protein L3 [Nocardioides sp.]|nr:50S ribosomal protein L3 [Halobacteriovoraceae bacterium]MBS45553.1 50S ribosomal protein L3 [Nocardioides sp.]|tara:strand:+ start:98 stop:751 length:654 start_codon:yes stop_codon:yes gene_type:complete
MSEATKISLPALYGKKAGMTRIFDESGKHIPVTVVQLIPNVVSQVKTLEKDGYNAYQLAYFEKREKLVSNPLKGHLKKAGVDKAFHRFAEVRSEEVSEENLGKELSLEVFTPNTFVDVTGTSKGKGFAGAMKRHNFQGGPAAHGSKFHRRTGSIGNRATPGRVFPQKKMPGHMGVETKTIQNLQVVEVNEEQGYMLIKGSLPGSKNGFVKIAKALKK